MAPVVETLLPARKLPSVFLEGIRLCLYFRRCDKAQIVLKLCQKWSMWRCKNEGLFISFLGGFFPTSPLISLILLRHMGHFWHNFNIFWALSDVVSFFQRPNTKSEQGSRPVGRNSIECYCDKIKIIWLKIITLKIYIRTFCYYKICYTF